MPADSRDEFLTVAEVAQLLRLNQQTVRNWIDQGSLPAIRVGARRVRIRRTDLDAFLMEASGPDATNGAQPAPEAEAQSASDGRAELGQALDRAWTVVATTSSRRRSATSPIPRVDSREPSSSDRTETHATAALTSEPDRHSGRERRDVRAPAFRLISRQMHRPVWPRLRPWKPAPTTDLTLGRILPGRRNLGDRTSGGQSVKPPLMGAAGATGGRRSRTVIGDDRPETPGRTIVTAESGAQTEAFRIAPMSTQALGTCGPEIGDERGRDRSLFVSWFPLNAEFEPRRYPGLVCSGCVRCKNVAGAASRGRIALLGGSGDEREACRSLGAGCGLSVPRGASRLSLGVIGAPEALAGALVRWLGAWACRRLALCASGVGPVERSR
jgi:excisionase family DNA binding protein